MKRLATLVIAIATPVSLLLGGMAGFPWDKIRP
jgi:hypothetical protein